MNYESRFFLIVLMFFLLFFANCKKEVASIEGTAPSLANRPPIARAGSDQTIVLPTDSVVLNGSESNDPDGHKITFKWTNLSGPALFTMAASDSSKTAIYSLKAGVYLFQLTVTDGAGLSNKDTISISVDDPTFNQPPTAFAGGDISVTLPNNFSTLNGSGSTDMDGYIVSFLWTQLSGPNQSIINNPSQAITSVNNLIQGFYQYELKVTDNGGLTARDTLRLGILTAAGSCDNRPIINAQLVQIGSLSEGRRSLVSASVGNKILFAGGFRPGAYSSRVDIYDVVNNTWATAELSKPERQGMAAATVGNKVFFAGGGDNDNGDVTSRVDIYDASTNTWSTAELSKAREYLTATTLGNKIFFAGGGAWEPNLIGSTVVDIYDNATNTWSTASLGEGRMDHTATLAGDKIYFAGGTKGYYTSLGVLSSIDIFDASNNTWSTSNLQEPKMAMADAYINGKILWVGGWSSASLGNGFASAQQAEIKNLNSGSTSFVCIRPRGFLKSAVRGDEVIFFTGMFSGDGIHFEIYKASNDTWSTGKLNRRIYDATIITVNNTIYVAGGVESQSGTVYNQLWKLEF